MRSPRSNVAGQNADDLVSPDEGANVRSFATALHSPSLHGVKVAVTGPSDQATALADGLNKDSSLGLDVRVVRRRAMARRRPPGWPWREAVESIVLS